jgi:hypothetical protein
MQTHINNISRILSTVFFFSSLNTAIFVLSNTYQNTYPSIFHILPEIPALHYMFSMSEAFYLATRGGAEVLGLANTCGDLTAGKKCDVLVVNTGIEPMDLFGFETLVTRNRERDSIYYQPRYHFVPHSICVKHIFKYYYNIYAYIYLYRRIDLKSFCLWVMTAISRKCGWMETVL